jgi:hypothetical protein
VNGSIGHRRSSFVIAVTRASLQLQAPGRRRVDIKPVLARLCKALSHFHHHEIHSKLSYH